MAQRVNDCDNLHSSPLQELSYFWQEAEKPPPTQRNYWTELFEMAVLSRPSISVPVIIKTPTEQNPLVPAVLGDLTVTTATEKVVYLLDISFGKSSRKMKTDKYSHTSMFVLEVA